MKYKAPEPGRDGRTKKGAGLGQGLVTEGRWLGMCPKR